MSLLTSYPVRNSPSNKMQAELQCNELGNLQSGSLLPIHMLLMCFFFLAPLDIPYFYSPPHTELFNFLSAKRCDIMAFHWC